MFLNKIRKTINVKQIPQQEIGTDVLDTTAFNFCKGGEENMLFATAAAIKNNKIIEDSGDMNKKEIIMKKKFSSCSSSSSVNRQRQLLTVTAKPQATKKQELLPEKSLKRKLDSTSSTSSTTSVGSSFCCNNDHDVKIKRGPVKQHKILKKATYGECGICFETIDEQGILDTCSHKFCHSCISQWFERSCRCPHCKRIVNKLTSSNNKKPVVLVEHRELKETLCIEDQDLSDSDGDDIFDYLDSVSLMARSVGMRLNYSLQSNLLQTQDSTLDSIFQTTLFQNIAKQKEIEYEKPEVIDY